MFNTAARTAPGAGSGAGPVTLTEIVPPGGTGLDSRVSTSLSEVGIATYALVEAAAWTEGAGAAAATTNAALKAPANATRLARIERGRIGQRYGTTLQRATGFEVWSSLRVPWRGSGNDSMRTA